MDLNLDELEAPETSFPAAPQIVDEVAEQTEDEEGSMPESILPNFEIWCDDVISRYEQKLMERNEELEKAMEDANELVTEYNLLRESRKRGKRTITNPGSSITIDDFNPAAVLEPENNLILNIKQEPIDRMEF